MDENEKKDEVTTIAGEESKEDPKEKRIKELERKLGEMGKELGDKENYIQDANRVINTVAYSPELREHFRKVYSGEVPGEQQDKNEKEKDTTGNEDKYVKEVDSRVRGVEESQRESVVRDFESKYGINKMSPEGAKKARSMVESFLNDFGQSIRTVPVNRLNSVLDKAFVATHAERLKEEGRLEGFTKMAENSMGSMPTFSGGREVEDQKPQPTKGQLDWAKKLNVDTSKIPQALEEMAKETKE